MDRAGPNSCMPSAHGNGNRQADRAQRAFSGNEKEKREEKGKDAIKTDTKVLPSQIHRTKSCLLFSFIETRVMDSAVHLPPPGTLRMISISVT